MNRLKELRKRYTDDYEFFEMILDNFGITKNIVNRLIEKQEKHGDSWIDGSLANLHKRIDIIFKEYKSREFILDLEQKGILDLINQSILLLIRLKQEKNFLGKYD